jgi:hypothetical protein
MGRPGSGVCSAKARGLRRQAPRITRVTFYRRLWQTVCACIESTQWAAMRGDRRAPAVPGRVCWDRRRTKVEDDTCRGLGVAVVVVIVRGALLAQRCDPAWRHLARSHAPPTAAGCRGMVRAQPLDEG